MNDILVCEDLCVSYDREEPVLKALDLRVPQGAVYGLIGRNGAGKTSALRAMLGLVAPSAGRVTVFGEESRAMSKAARRRIGYLAEGEFAYDDVPFLDLLRFLSGFYERWDWGWCKHLAERLRVDESKSLDSLSKGQRRIAELLLAVAHKPDLLVLDDPALGLDAGVRRELLWTLLETVQEQGTTVLFSSHILQDVEQVVDHLAILDQGRLRLAGSFAEIQERFRRLVLAREGAPEHVAGEISRAVRGQEVQIVTQAFDPGMLQRLPVRDSGRLSLEEIFLVSTADVEVPA